MEGDTRDLSVSRAGDGSARYLGGVGPDQVLAVVHALLDQFQRESGDLLPALRLAEHLVGDARDGRPWSTEFTRYAEALAMFVERCQMSSDPETRAMYREACGAVQVDADSILAAVRRYHGCDSILAEVPKWHCSTAVAHTN